MPILNIAVRPRVLRRWLLLAGFGAMSAGVFLADLLAWAVTR